MDAHPEIREFMDQANKDRALYSEAQVQKTGRKQGDLPDIRRLSSAEKVESLEQEPLKRVHKYWDGVVAQEPKAFDSPSSMTEDSDEKDALRARSFKLGYKEMGVDIKTTTAEEVTSMTDSATESAIDSTTELTEEASEEIHSDKMEAKEAEITEEVEEVVETTEEAKTTDTEATSEAETTSKEEIEEKSEPVEEKKEEESSGSWFSSLFGGKKK